MVLRELIVLATLCVATSTAAAVPVASIDLAAAAAAAAASSSSGVSDYELFDDRYDSADNSHGMDFIFLCI